MAKSNEEEEYQVIFRRYKKGKDGKLMDAFTYGLKAWPIRIAKTKDSD